MSASLEITDAAAEAVAVAARVRLEDIEDAIRSVYYATGLNLCDATVKRSDLGPLMRLTICVVVMRNGYTVIGKSAPASPENFDAALGQRFAYEDAVRQLWPLMGYALRELLALSE